MWMIQDRNDRETVNQSDLLIGHIVADGHQWVCRTTGGTTGISLGDPDGLLHLAVRPSQGELLPVAGENYVRGDEWKIHMPQRGGQFSLRMSLRVIDAAAERLVIEPTFSIQTTLLDTHPTLILSAVGGEVRTSRIDVADQRFTAWTIRFSGETGQIAVLLGPHDAPHTVDRSTNDSISLQLFGEFLEKGVIRKARPWVILDRSDADISREDLRRYADALSRTPLPLTA